MALAPRIVVALVLLGSLVGGAGCKRRRADPARARPPAPAGGAASSLAEEGADAGDADGGLVEDARRYQVRTWAFALERYAITIEDVGMTRGLAEVLARTEAELAVNGGFFDPNGKALGLAISNGALLSKASPSMSGGVITSDGERAQLWESETFSLPEGTRFGVQCKPRLVVGGALNIKRDDGQRSERTALCLRDGGRTIEVAIIREEGSEMGGPSLFAFGRWLVRHGCEGALNLDGGPSTGVAWREDGAAKVLAPRGPLRHAIVFKKR